MNYYVCRWLDDYAIQQPRVDKMHSIFEPHCMHSIDAAYCYTRFGVVCLCVSLFVRNGDESCKTAEPIELSFGMWALLGPHNHVC